MHLPDLKIAANREKKDNIYIELNEDIKDIYNGKKYFLRTYGCQMNVHDSEQIRYYLEALGYTNTDIIEESDIVVLNTCAIRENAKDKVVGFLGKCKHIKKEKEDFRVVLCGCMCEQPDFIDDVIKKYKYIDLVIGTHNIHELPNLITKLDGKQLIEVYSNSDEVIENQKYTRDSHITAWVNIMYGCDKFCTYCIVPYTRGRERSRKKEDILKEVECLKKAGYKEITLLGQNVNAYGRDIGVSFASLLEDVAKIGIERVRFVTSHPWNFTDEMIDVIAKYDNIMPYIHLPLQSGSTEILKKMNRRYTKEEYLELFNKMKERIPGVSITTDIIVGFPNETEEEFLETLEMVKTCKYDGAYTFVYSPRVGTPAAKMKDNVSEEVKLDRLHRLNEVVNYYSNLSNQKYLNKIVKVLILGVSDKDNTKLYGYTDTFKLVNVIGDKDIIGNIVDVKITDAKSFSLDGEYVNLQ